ncbi:DUF4129 domain-containing protein [bacterium RCC_150]
MSMSAVLPFLLPGFDAPVDPDAGEARRWAAEELSKSRYASAKPGWIEEIWRQFIEWLRSMNGESIGAPNIALPLIMAIAVVLIVVVIIVVRPRLNARKRHSAAVFDGDASVTAETFRIRASEAANRNDWQTAVVEQFRALVRTAEDRAVIDVQAGRTADEAATHLGRAFATTAPRLDAAARLFDSVKYGRAAATGADHAELLALDSDLSVMKPDFAAQAGNGLAVPQ